MWKELLQVFFNEMSPVTKKNWSHGLTITWRGVLTIAIIYIINYTTTQRQNTLVIVTKQDSILRNQQWERWQIESITRYMTDNLKDNKDMRGDITTLQEDFAEIKGRLGIKVRGIY